MDECGGQTAQKHDATADTVGRQRHNTTLAPSPTIILPAVVFYPGGPGWVSSPWFSSSTHSKSGTDFFMGWILFTSSNQQSQMSRQWL